MIVDVGQLGTAHFSDDRVYRYLLTRTCGNAAPAWWVTYVMLNPSTADADENDPTIGRCISFGERFCEGWQGPRDLLGIRIVNLYAFRSPHPKVCFAAPKPVGGVENDRAILAACSDSALVIAAWGAATKARARASEVRQMLAAAGVKLHRLGPPTKEGAPSHPLYLDGDTKLEAWTT